MHPLTAIHCLRLSEAANPRPGARDVLLTIDLSPGVVQEALKSSNTGMIVAYHPPIFKPLKSLTLSNPLQKYLLQCASAGISVYSPHTALDCVHGGINDWLGYGVLGLSADDIHCAAPYASSCIKVLGEPKAEGAGLGRIVEVNDLSIGILVDRLQGFMCVEHVQVALAPGASFETYVHSIAVCAGSGGSVLGGVQADVYVTGEMPHHEVLAAVASGTHVILCGHTNTERGYLPKLADWLGEELKVLDVKDVSVTVSQVDAHPLRLACT